MVVRTILDHFGPAHFPTVPLPLAIYAPLSSAETCPKEHAGIQKMQIKALVLGKPHLWVSQTVFFGKPWFVRRPRMGRWIRLKFSIALENFNPAVRLQKSTVGGSPEPKIAHFCKNWQFLLFSGSDFPLEI